MEIRAERPDDKDEIFNVTEEAFRNAECASHTEQFLPEKLRHSDLFIPELSLVAVINGKIVGHAMFTKQKIGNINGVILAPLSIHPEYQRQGIGTKLVLEGHRIAKQLGYSASVLIGHANYYPRFGYERLSKYGISYEPEMPDENSLGIQLVEGAFSNLSGTKIQTTPLFAD